MKKIYLTGSEMFLKSEIVLFRIGESTKNLINAIFGYLFEGYQENIAEKRKGSDFVFDYVDKLYYNCHKKSLNRGGLYIGSLKWLEN